MESTRSSSRTGSGASSTRKRSAPTDSSPDTSAESLRTLISTRMYSTTILMSPRSTCSGSPKAHRRTPSNLNDVHELVVEELRLVLEILGPVAIDMQGFNDLLSKLLP